MIFLWVSILLTYFFGESNFKKLKMTGPFEVGHREIRSSVLGSEVSVYYPIDREHHRLKIRESRNNTSWIRHGDKTILGIAKASVPYGRDDHLPLFLFRFMRYIKIDTVENGDLTSFFSQIK